jgi:hypothetical protein
MTLDDYLNRRKSELRLFEHWALKQQNAEQLSVELPDFEWEKQHAEWEREKEKHRDE